MGKAIGFLLLLGTLIAASQEIRLDEKQLQEDCLQCHQQQQIPNEIVYRRYLSIYSTHGRMKEAMAAYLRDPKKDHSTMPPQFFLKFPMKEKSMLDKERLMKDIELYLDKFDIKKKLILQP